MADLQLSWSKNALKSSDMINHVRDELRNQYAGGRVPTQRGVKLAPLGGWLNDEHYSVD